MYKALEQWDFDKRHGKNRLKQFAEVFKEYQKRIDFKVSARGWAYLMEQAGFITKDKFDLVNDLLNRCRKRGLLPVDFCAEDVGRQFHEIHEPDMRSPGHYVERHFDYIDDCEDWYTPDYWAQSEFDDLYVEAEKFYIQMVVEKVDLLTLFQPVCKKYHVPIANSKGWQSIFQRAQYARRFKDALDRGLQPVLLYCGDHDPDGLRISDTLMKNLEDIKNVVWSDGQTGFDPSCLIIKRFGLNYDFIIRNNLTWIDNLITGSGKDLASPHHPNYQLDYVQDYLRTVGERKCEANAIVVNPESARELCALSIESFVGEDALKRFQIRELINRLKVIEVKNKIKVFDEDGNHYSGWDNVSDFIKKQII